MLVRGFGARLVTAWADMDDDSDEEGKHEAKLWMNWNLESYEGDSPDREPTNPADGK
jgi:hypothetical protein